MIIYKKAQKKDLPLLIEHKLKTISPYLGGGGEKLKAIAYVNGFIKNNFDKFIIIYYFFKKIGSFLILDNELDTIYIIKKYRNKGIGSKILKKENIKALKFYEKNGFMKKNEQEDCIILERKW